MKYTNPGMNALANLTALHNSCRTSYSKSKPDFPARFAEAGDDDEDSEGDETVERVIERLRDVNHSYLEKSKQVKKRAKISFDQPAPH